jgi:hypothetical protein
VKAGVAATRPQRLDFTFAAVATIVHSASPPDFLLGAADACATVSIT